MLQISTVVTSTGMLEDICRHRVRMEGRNTAGWILYRRAGSQAMLRLLRWRFAQMNVICVERCCSPVSPSPSHELLMDRTT
ncbi:unnamed protein product [Nippostrongylus brasiliensis]|uniref:Uncharacterized protein n=1 Tax=Nippostrongylus brasiliensis TaxID=27835 RepID=A0A0N4XD43_NIPBR|nr:hypothetical protein Q1695_005921 [Nippostrongylus brasiliensis]VDL62994.1 unnamed protein product [Nippostrongylus brasiliensis]